MSTTQTLGSKPARFASCVEKFRSCSASGSTGTKRLNSLNIADWSMRRRRARPCCSPWARSRNAVTFRVAQRALRRIHHLVNMHAGGSDINDVRTKILALPPRDSKRAESVLLNLADSCTASASEYRISREFCSAEGDGFEPPAPAGELRFSRPEHSSAPPTLRGPSPLGSHAEQDSGEGRLTRGGRGTLRGAGPRCRWVPGTPTACSPSR